jgi:hypothetical protein
LVTTLAGQVIAGGSVSVTVTVNAHRLVLPAASVATQLTVVTPFGKVEPDSGVQTVVTPGQLSAAVTVKVTFAAEHWPGSVERTMFAGQVIASGWASLTMTVKEHRFVLPVESVAMQFTVVTPFGNVEPDGGVQTVVTPGQLSAVFTVKVTFDAEHWPGSVARTRLAGQAMAGACVSLTVTVNKQSPPLVVLQLTIVLPTGKNKPDGGVHVTAPQSPLVVGAR